ncbi:MAG: nonstructural protein [Arizlama microvirus]|nr:MAG: nonstructural protein [Arizlama microvirus]
MIYQVCAVRDSAMDAYLRPFFVPSTNVAVRSFTDEVNRKSDDNAVNKHPDDYELYCLGQWDENTGIFTQSGDSLLVRAKDVIKE